MLANKKQLKEELYDRLFLEVGHVQQPEEEQLATIGYSWPVEVDICQWLKSL